MNQYTIIDKVGLDYHIEATKMSIFDGLLYFLAEEETVAVFVDWASVSKDNA